MCKSQALERVCNLKKGKKKIRGGGCGERDCGLIKHIRTGKEPGKGMRFNETLMSRH